MKLFRVAVLIGLASACAGQSPTGPRQQTNTGTTTTTTTTTPITPNSAPQILSLSVSASRVEENNQVTLTANVQDDITVPDQLTYEWSASPNPGEFTGTGREVRWRAPRLMKTPDLYTITLNVIEKFTEGGVAKENKSTSTVTVHYNDSSREVSTLSTDFLNDFATYSVSAEQCVRNFSDGCTGKAAELGDITNNRNNLQILSGKLGTPLITFDGGLTFANSNVPCTFVSIVKSTGRTETAAGTCLLTAVYEGFRWFLCTSNFSGTTSSNVAGLHPGRRVGIKTF